MLNTMQFSVLRPPTARPARLTCASPAQISSHIPHYAPNSQRLSSVRAQASVEFVEGISKEEAARFDRIAASLIAKIDQVEDYIEGTVVLRKPVLPDKLEGLRVWPRGSLAQSLQTLLTSSFPRYPATPPLRP